MYYFTEAGGTSAGQISYISGRLALARRKSASRYAAEVLFGMMPVNRVYSSKEEIYRDFDIAIKFRLAFDVSREFYHQLYAVLGETESWAVQRFERDVSLLSQNYPSQAIGAFVEIPVHDGKGRSIGHRCVLLGHETGPETWFEISNASILPTGLGMLWSMLKDRVVPFAREWAITVGYMNNPIRFVELRTQHKGVMRISFENLKSSQLDCLVGRIESVDHISLLNSSCFEGLLFEPIGGSDDGIGVS